MPHMPVLRVVPLGRIRRHEEFDPIRVDRLRHRIDAEGIQANPMVCVESANGELVLLDGATRAETLKTMGLEYAVVQIVDEHTIDLGTWHHVVRGCSPEELLAAVGGDTNLQLSEHYGTPSIHPNRGPSRLVTGRDGLTTNATLSALVDSYVGRWRVTRTIDPARDHVAKSFPGWAAVIEFPTLTVDDVMRAAIGHDLLPAGITRFLVPDRALRLNVPLEILGAGHDIDTAQARMEQILEERSSEGRVRRYEGPVFILDD